MTCGAKTMMLDGPYECNMELHAGSVHRTYDDCVPPCVKAQWDTKTLLGHSINDPHRTILIYTTA